MQTDKRYSRRQFLGQATTLVAFTIVPRRVLGGRGFLAPSDRITLGFIGAEATENLADRYLRI